jgi:hypothetical protein
MAEIMGTAFQVHGQWYLRYLQGGGAMVPISGDREILAALSDNQMCVIEGHLSTDGRGCGQGVSARSVRMLGS